MNNYDELIEDKLKKTLRKITPNPNFVKNLQNSFYSNPTISVESNVNFYVIILIALSLFFGGVLYWVIYKMYKKIKN